MEISLERLNILAYQHLLYDRTFLLKESNVKWFFLPPIGENVGTGKVSIINVENNTGHISDYQIQFEDTRYVLSIEGVDYKILSFLYHTLSSPTSLQVQNSAGKILMWEEVK